MSYGKGVVVGHLVTLRRFLMTFWRDVRTGKGLHRRGGGYQVLDFWGQKAKRGDEPVVRQDDKTDGLFTVEYPDERLPVYERFRVLPMLVYDDDDGNVRCTSCNICAKVCPPQCIWMTQAKGPKGVVPLPEEFFIDMDVCMNCGLCSEYCPFDAIKMDHNFELSNYERHQTHIFSLQDLLVSSEYYSRTHPEAWSSAAEVTERGKVAKKKDQRLQKALTATPKPAPAKAAPAAQPVTAEQA
jgi:NADH-quinone oxidoreductase subunit I